MGNTVRKAILVACISLVCFTLVRVVSGQGTQNASRSSSNTFASANWFPVTGNSGAVANSSSVMIRNADGVAYTISTTGLLPGGAYTNWWVVFNEPQFCSPPGCAAKDFPQNGGNPNVGASVLWATGRVVDANGQGYFAAHLAAGGVSAAPGEVRFWPGAAQPSRGNPHHRPFPWAGLGRSQHSSVTAHDGGWRVPAQHLPGPAICAASSLVADSR